MRWSLVALGISALAGLAATIWTALRENNLRSRSRALKRRERMLHDQASLQQAATLELAEEMTQKDLDFQLKLAELESKRMGIDCIQAAIAEMFAEATPSPDILAGCTLVTAVDKQRQNHAFAGDSNIRIVVAAENSHITLFVKRKKPVVAKHVYALLRHRATGYLRLATIKNFAKTTIPLFRLKSAEILTQQMLGEWELNLIASGRVEQRAVLELTATDSIFFSNFNVLSKRIGVMANGAPVPLQQEKQIIDPSRTQSLFPYLRLRTPWPRPFRLRVSLQDKRGQVKFSEERSCADNLTFDWITEVPLNVDDSNGPREVRWQAGPLYEDQWFDVARWEWEITLKRSANISDWLDAEGELKDGYDQSISAIGITAKDILAKLGA